MTKDWLHDDLAEGTVPFDPADYNRKANAAGLVGRVKAHGPWYAELVLAKRGVSKAILANAIMALRKAPQWDNLLWHNEFTTATVARRGRTGSPASGGWCATTRRTLLLCMPSSRNAGAAGGSRCGRRFLCGSNQPSARSRQPSALSNQ